MHPSKKLSLRRESMTDLTLDQLRSAVGAYSGDTCTVCPTEGVSCVRCPSLPLTNCTILTETDTVTCPTDIC